MLVTFIIVIPFTGAFHMIIWMKPCEAVTFLHSQHLILSLNLMPWIFYFTIKIIIN